MSLCDIIIPTLDNPQYLIPCLQSLIGHTAMKDNIHIFVVNNGAKEIESVIPKNDKITIIHAEKNLGWEGGLKLGLANSKSEFVCFANDDIFIPFFSAFWTHSCLSMFSDANVAAVGPVSNCVAGRQNIFFGNDTPNPYPDVSFLIGYCMFVRRKYLDEMGGIDDTLPGGDDFDLSIRFIKAGYKLKVCRTAFVYHHGFKTGERLHGGPNKPGGWNSREMTDRTNHALIRKHGFENFLNCFRDVVISHVENNEKTEKEIVHLFLKGQKWLELGCGADKVDDSAIGVDRIANGDTIPFMNGMKSKAEIQADVSKPLPFEDKTFDTLIARHVLEHCLDPIETIEHWVRLLKEDGRLVISVPDQRYTNTIPLNAEHVHAYTPDSLERLMTFFKLKKVGFVELYNGIAFTMAFERNGSSV